MVISWSFCVVRFQSKKGNRLDAYPRPAKGLRSNIRARWLPNRSGAKQTFTNVRATRANAKSQRRSPASWPCFVEKLVPDAALRIHQTVLDSIVSAQSSAKPAVLAPTVEGPRPTRPVMPY